MKLKQLAQCLALAGLASSVAAQTTDASLQKVEITGSLIKRIAAEGALPVQIITAEDIKAQGIVSADQLIMNLNANGNGLDNLASNADVVAGAQRGLNGFSGANLRGQGTGSTLVLLNGRRVAAYGMGGGGVDVNSIPIAAVERVEILKDGASATYGTDAIGGVINFITKKNYNGVQAEAFTDQTQHGGGNINRVSVLGGFGDLAKDNYNLLVSLNRSENQVLRGDQRAFVNTFQPSRGLSVDTRGTPYATVFAISSLNSALSLNNTNATGRGTGPTLPGSTQTYNGINVLNLPGGAGCGVIDGQAAYDAVLWASPASKFGCAWDTGRAAVLQQPVKNTNLVARGTLNVGAHQVYAELTGAQVETNKSFSPSQLTSSTSATSPLFNLSYPSTGVAYNSVFNQLVAAFPQLEANRGLPLAMRWRCMPCGNREIATTSTSMRGMIGADGPLPWIKDWDYRAGLSTAYSESTSTLGGGYYYSNALAATINSGLLNPFLMPGQSQTPAATAALDAASARGAKLYGGRYMLTQADAMATGPLFAMPAGTAMGAVGMDIRSESYKFNGSYVDLVTQTNILNAPFDNIDNLSTVKRDIKALYGEMLLPLTKKLEATASVRHDDYTGFGGTTNPKVSLRFTPADTFLMRASYNTGFRVPTFNQLFYGVTESPYAGKDLVDPASCATLKVDPTKAGCAAITPTVLTGGRRDLGPEKSKQWSVGFVAAPSDSYSFGADWWTINRTGTIQTLALSDITANYNLFSKNYIRDASGNVISIDDRWVNAGETQTTGIDVMAHAMGKAFAGKWRVALDGTYLVDKKSRLTANSAFGASEVANFTRAGDLGLRWKHTLTGTYTQGYWSTTLMQVHRSGYTDAMLPGVANGSIVPPNWNANVAAYTTYNLSVSYTGFKDLGLTFGIKNLLDTAPPFSVAYDGNTGAGSSWEPRVADPRLRSFTLMANYKFK